LRRPVLLLLLSIASADADPKAIASGEWGLGLFLQLGTGGGGAWEDAKVGDMARFETVSTFSLPDPVGAVRKKEREHKVSQYETRVVKGDDGQLALQTRGRPSNERGEPGKWEKPRTSELPVRTGKIEDWKVERIGDTTCRVGAQSLAATSYRVRIPDPGAPQTGEIWTVALGSDTGVLQAKRESGDEIEWKLVRMDVEVKVGGRKLKCREYELRWEPPKELEKIAVKHRYVFLSDEVPGHVVRQVYTAFVATSVEENLISFGGR